MAKPRVFISSTFFDLKQVRADLDRFIKEVGYEPVRNEVGNIPYGKDEKLEEYCYKEISDIDILVGIIGGRYGSESSYEPYSISQIEIKTALEQQKQVYLFIEKNVLAEYQTYLINKENKTIKFKFVDNPKIYDFIQEVELLPKNNVIQGFETAQEIVNYLKEQWAGLFRDLIIQHSQKKQIETLSSKVNELSEVSTTLKRYLEEVLQASSLQKSNVQHIITEETKRLESQRQISEIQNDPYIRHLVTSHKIDIHAIYEALLKTKTYRELKEILFEKEKRGIPFCIRDKRAFDDLNRARIILGLPEYMMDKDEVDESEFRNRRWIGRRDEIVTEALEVPTSTDGKPVPSKKTMTRKKRGND
jgi:hypothetical protein